MGAANNKDMLYNLEHIWFRVRFSVIIYQACSGLEKPREFDSMVVAIFARYPRCISRTRAGAAEHLRETFFFYSAFLFSDLTQGWEQVNVFGMSSYYPRFMMKSVAEQGSMRCWRRFHEQIRSHSSDKHNHVVVPSNNIFESKRRANCEKFWKSWVLGLGVRCQTCQKLLHMVQIIYR